MFAFDHINGFNVDNASAVSSNFFGGEVLVFQHSIARRKTVVQPVCLGWHCKPSPVGFRGKTLDIFGYFVF